MAATGTVFPTLEGVSFDEIFTFSREWQHATRSRPGVAAPKAVESIAPFVVEVWQTVSGKRDVPDKVEDMITALFEAFRPAIEAARFARLRRVHWCPPATEASFASLVRHTSEFFELARALDVKDYAAIRIYSETLRGPVAHAARLAVQMQEKPDITSVTKAAYNAASASDIVRQLDTRPTTSAPHHVRSASAMHSPDNGKRLQIVRPQAPAVERLSESEKERCILERRCFICKQSGHKQDQCPQTASTMSLQSRSHGQALAAAAPHLSTSTRSPPPSLTTAQPAPPLSQRPQRTRRMPASLSDYETHVVTEDTESHGSAILALDIVGAQPPRTVSVLPDTGAARCHIRRAYVEALKLPQRPVPSQSFHIANGDAVVCEHVVDLPLRLEPCAPVRTCVCWVHDRVPPANYVLLGRDALNGFAVTLASPPRIEWVQTATLEDRADPIDIPEPEETLASLATTTKSSDPVAVVAEPMVQLGDKLAPTEKQEVAVLLREYCDVFAPLTQEPAVLPPFKIVLKEGSEPFRAKPLPLSADRRNFVRTEIDRLLQLQIIQPSTSAWAAPIVIATKRNGQYRLCVDFSRLNQQTVREANPLPRVDDLTHAVAGRPYLAAFDMTMGYHQAPVDPASRHLLAFVTAFGLYEYTRLPFGVTNGPPYFQRVISNVFRQQRDVITYIDDCAVASCNFAEFMAGLRAVFDTARQHKLHFNPSISVIGPAVLPYLGRLIGPMSVAIDPERIRPLRDLQPPTNKALLRTFLGLVQYHSRFIPQLATTAAPLWELTKKDVSFNWEPQHTTVFNVLKQAILEAPMLAQPQPAAQQILRTDASSYGIGGQLLQRDRDTQKLQPLAYFSRRLTPAEQRYATIEQEALAIVFCLDKARPLILGPVIIQTDHRNLQFLRSSINHRVQRWAALLADFDFIIEYRPGALNHVADCLSRLSCSTPHKPDQPLTSAINLLEGEEGAQPSQEEIAIALQDKDSIAAIARGLPHHVERGVVVLEQCPPQEVAAKVWVLVQDDILAGHLGSHARYIVPVQQSAGREWRRISRSAQGCVRGAKRPKQCPPSQRSSTALEHGHHLCLSLQTTLVRCGRPMASGTSWSCWTASPISSS